MYIEGASTYAPVHDLIMLWVNIITILAFLVVNTALVYFIIRYRRRSDSDHTSDIASSTVLEITWTIIPTIIMVFFYVWGLRTFQAARTVPDNVLDIAVTGKQWIWDFHYPNNLQQNNDRKVRLKTTGTLYLQENRPTRLIMQSQDVIHSFFIPAFRVKEDVVPGMYSYLSFTPLISESQKKDNRAEYVIFCAEYCGRDHSYMSGKVVVLPEAEFLETIAQIEEEANNVSAEIGEQIHNSNCKSCHSLDGTRLVGPSFQGLWGKNRRFTDGTEAVADENYIYNSIMEPNSQIVEGYPAAMPVQDYTNAQINSIIEFLKELK